MSASSSCLGIGPVLLLGIGLTTPSHNLNAAASNTNAGPTRAESSPLVAVETKTNTIENAVVKVFATVRYPDPYRPWTKQAPTEVAGTGVIINGKRILSNAHIVLYASQVQVQANQAGDKISATVEAIAPGIDLALLKLEDETLFDSHPPLPRANTLPDIKDVVMAYGYPHGGTSLSITKGIVSRIDFVAYNYSVSGLRVQIDAAINPGNSGGPAVVGDKMVGLAFSRLGGSENIGYIIPCEEIELFLHDVAGGRCDSKLAMYDELQTLENAALRSFLKVGKSVQGMVVHKPDSTDPAYPLKEWDVITKIGDTPLDDQGMIKFSGNLRVAFNYLIQKTAKDGKVPLTVVREGKEMEVQLPGKSKRPMVCPPLEGSYSSYFVYGPLVFSTATSEFISGLSRSGRGISGAGLQGLMASPLVKRILDKPAFEGERLVVVSSPFFPNKIAKGYSNPIGQVVKSISNVPIKNLNHLVEVLRDSKEQFVTVEFHNQGAETLVFSRTEMVATTEEILTDNGLRSQGSPDTLAIWNAKASQ